MEFRQPNWSQEEVTPALGELKKQLDENPDVQPSLGLLDIAYHTAEHEPKSLAELVTVGEAIELIRMYEN